MNIQALLFDMDGVLFDTEAFSTPLIIDIIARQNLSITKETVIAHMGQAANDLLAGYQSVLGPTFNGPLFLETYWRERKAFYATHPLPIKPGAQALLQSCQSANIPCVLATSSPTQEAIANLRRANLLPFFAGVIGGDQFQHSKPAPDIYLAAARLAQRPIAQCLVLEDSMTYN